MISSLPRRKIITIGPMPAEKGAYALARYSRSPETIEESIRWVHTHSSEKFWEQYYFKYGHASIADLGHIMVCFENISELAAIELEDEPLWDGQAKSTRYQDFSNLGYFIPDELAGSPLERIYRETVGSLLETYTAQHHRLKGHLAEQHPRPQGMNPEEYHRAINARAFDLSRYLLPLAVPTNIGQVVNVRTLEKQIGRLLSSSTPELIDIGRELVDSCSVAPLNLWTELVGGGPAAEPVAPTLARHARKSEYLARTYTDLGQWAAERIRLDSIDSAPPVDLIAPHPLLEEVVTTLLYRVTQAPYRQILKVVQGWSEKEQHEVVEIALRRRGEKDDLLREFRSGYPLIFDLLMDVGAFRDLHRHRRCQQIRQSWTVSLGYEIPEPLRLFGLESDYDQAMEGAGRASRALGPSPAADYLVPFGYRVRCLFKMDFAQADYICRLRSGVKGHFSYRRIAWAMKEALALQYPFLASKIVAVPPHVEDPLTR